MMKAFGCPSFPAVEATSGTTTPWHVTHEAERISKRLLPAQ